jgi:hypothetical protein
MSVSRLSISLLQRNLLRRNFSSKPQSIAGAIKPKVLPQHEQTELAHEGEITFVTPEMQMKNGALATALIGFAFGVAYYSMHAVGQAGLDEVDDPLALLKQEAAQAQELHDKEEQQAGDANDMLKQFQAGDFDPDKYDELEEEKPKRPWYKFF